MAIFDIFKKKKETVKPKKEAEKTSKIEAVKKFKKIKKSPALAAAKPAEATAAPKPKKDISDLAYRVLGQAHITEKATDLADKNQYVFRVFPRANKIEIKKAIEDVYRVNVVSVRVITIHSKKRVTGGIQGWKQGYKKAIVKIKEGQKIEVLPR